MLQLITSFVSACGCRIRELSDRPNHLHICNNPQAPWLCVLWDGTFGCLMLQLVISFVPDAIAALRAERSAKAIPAFARIRVFPEWTA